MQAGKSSFLQRFAEGGFTESYIRTVRTPTVRPGLGTLRTTNICRLQMFAVSRTVL